MSIDLVASINNNRCPDCGNYGFVPGPRGGAGRNLFCANPECRSGFNVAPLAHAAFVQRIDKAQECFYPHVHILRLGLPMCRFAMVATPSEWPLGHSWTGDDEAQYATCPQCLQAVGKYPQNPPILPQ